MFESNDLLFFFFALFIKFTCITRDLNKLMKCHLKETVIKKVCLCFYNKIIINDLYMVASGFMFESHYLIVLINIFIKI